MTVTVTTWPPHEVTRLSPMGRLVLGFVDSGPEWLEWAIGDRRAYRFEDEGALVTGIQTGLHASPLLLLPKTGLLVSPVKLMTMRLADLEALAAAERGDTGKALSARVAKIPHANGLATEADIAGALDLLQQLKVADRPVFQCMGLNDALAIVALLDADEAAAAPDDLEIEAAAFAADRATTPPEFADYYLAYLGQVAASATSKDDADQRRALVENQVATLTPALFGALDCPRVEGLVAPADVQEAIDDWLRPGRQLGFARLSRGVQQVIAHGGLAQQADVPPQRAVAAYLEGAQTLLRTADLGPGQMGQDGATCIFPVNGTNAEAAVQLGADGIVTLASYRRLEPPAPPPPPQTEKP